MASYSEAYGFTPEEFFRLTLPQIAHYGEYSTRQLERINKEANTSKSGGGQSKSVSSLEEFVTRYGEKPKTAKE